MMEYSGEVLYSNALLQREPLFTSISPAPAKPFPIPYIFPTHPFPTSTVRVTRITKFLDMNTLLKVGWTEHF